MQKIIALGFQMMFCTLCISFAQHEPINPQEPFTVCQVLQNLDLYSGKIIQVRGTWGGSYVWDKCTTQLQTEEHQWPNEIYLPCTHLLGRDDKPVDWVFDIENYYVSMNEALRFKGLVKATIVGRLDVRAQLSHYPNGTTSPYGYGHLGRYPAQIVIMSIKDIIGSELRKSNEKIKIIDFY